MDDRCVSGLTSLLMLSSSLPHCVPPCLPPCLRPLSSSAASSASSSRAPNGAPDLQDVCGDRSVLLLQLPWTEKPPELSSSHVASNGHFSNPFLSQPPLAGNLACVSAVVWAVGEEPPEATPEALRRLEPPETSEFVISKRLVRIGGSEIPPGLSDALLRTRPGDVARVYIHPDKGFKGVYPRTLRQAVVEDDFLLADVCLHYWTLFENLTPSPSRSSCPLDHALSWASPTRCARFDSPRSCQLCPSALPANGGDAGADQREGGTERHSGAIGDKEERGQAAEEDFPKDLVLFFAYDRLKRDSHVSNTWRDESSNVSFSYHTFSGQSTTDTLDLARVQVSFALPRPHFLPSSARSPSSPPSASLASSPCPDSAVPAFRPSASTSPPVSPSPVLFHACASSLEEDETTPQVFEFLLDEEEAPYRGIESLVRNLRVGQAGDAWLSGQFAAPGKTAGSEETDRNGTTCDGEKDKASGEQGLQKSNGQRAAADKEERARERDGQEGEKGKVAGSSAGAAEDHRHREAGFINMGDDQAGYVRAKVSRMQTPMNKNAEGENRGNLSCCAPSGCSSTAARSPTASPVEKRAPVEEQDTDSQAEGCEDAGKGRGKKNENAEETEDDTEAQREDSRSAQCCRLLRGFVVRGIYPLPEPHHLATPDEKISMAKFIRENGNCWFKKGNFERALRRYLMVRSRANILKSHRGTCGCCACSPLNISEDTFIRIYTYTSRQCVLQQM
uniref:FKBP-type peptidyl-prolyl cis-trans isomerase,related n=1 Tax=Neospora caninum (strain Liverpool) TaxID=572307 RepID=A0A0F7U5S8_NEOCL|nr:TPA: FKBP-type peptidyl-prolyl cis-trans isomerase,related [Neospora caninum Liverpool]